MIRVIMIKAGKVINISVAKELGDVDMTGLDAIFDESDLPVEPGIGWLYDGVNFTPPPKSQEQIDREAADAALKIIEDNLQANLDALKLEHANINSINSVVALRDLVDKLMKHVFREE